MTHNTLRACAVLLCALLPPSTRAAYAGEDAAGHDVLVSRDASGRVQSRTILNADGSRHVVSNQYWAESQVVRLSVEEDLDRTGRPTRRSIQEFDDRGRPLERRTVSIDATGKEHGISRTRFTYDAQGRSSETTSPLGR